MFDTERAGERSIGFSVTDNGIGIALAEQSRIFEKLFRTEKAREIDADGAGLGLYLTKLVLGRLRGRIWFTSEKGVGTTFYVLIPYVIEPSIH
jgi:two-component system sensor histidine kinase VicK